MSALHWKLEHERWLVRKFEGYADARQDLIVWTETEPVVRDVTNLGAVEVCPALALFAVQPPRATRRRTPLLVVEFVSEGNFTQTWKGDADFYLHRAGVAEHWVVDLRAGPEWLVLSTRRWRKGGVRLIEFCRGDDLKTPTMPGFELLIDPRR